MSVPPAPPLPALGAAEQQQLLAALRQPLFLQTPLQSLLEHLVTRLASSTATTAELTTRVASLERAHVDGTDLLERVRALEARLAEAPAAAAPFAIANLTGRVGALEAASLRLEEEGRQLKYTTGDVSWCKSVRTYACLSIKALLYVVTCMIE